MIDGPAVIVLGVDTPIGLTVVRELAAYGARVHGIGWSARSVGLHSKHLQQGYLRAPDEHALVEQINRIARASHARWLLTVAEADILLLQRRRSDLIGVEALIPEPEPFAAVLDKSVTLNAARGVGLSGPRTWNPDTLAELEAISVAARFPVVLKWKRPLEAGPRLASAGLPLEKCLYAFDAAQLRAQMQRYAEAGPLPMVQEYAAGYGLGQMLLMHQGDAVLAFQHRRVAEWPPEGGVSAVCESVSLERHVDLRERSAALLQRLRFEGPAMVEYRFDPRSGEAKLMEVNGRFWGSLPLASQCGVPFAWATLARGAGLPIPAQVDYPDGYRCRYVIPEIKRLFRVLLARRAIDPRLASVSTRSELARFFGGYLRPSTGYYVGDLRDPGPLLHDLFHAILSRLASR